MHLTVSTPALRPTLFLTQAVFHTHPLHTRICFIAAQHFRSISTKPYFSCLDPDYTLITVKGLKYALTYTKGLDQASSERLMNHYLNPIRIYLHCGGDPNHRDEEGNSLLHAAARTGNAQLFFLLLKHGANKNLTNKKGELPLSLWQKPTYPNLTL